MIVTFTPFGVASEWSWKGLSPDGRSLSSRAPATGRLMPAKRPPDTVSGLQTLGGV